MPIKRNLKLFSRKTRNTIFARSLRHFQWDLVSKHLYDLVFLSIACLVTCMHIILFRHNLNFHFYYQERYTLSEFIVSQPLLVVFNYFVLQNFGLIYMHICSLTLFIFKIVLRTFPVKFWLVTYKFSNNSLDHVGVLSSILIILLHQNVEFAAFYNMF